MKKSNLSLSISTQIEDANQPSKKNKVLFSQCLERFFRKIQTEPPNTVNQAEKQQELTELGKFSR